MKRPFSFLTFLSAAAAAVALLLSTGTGGVQAAPARSLQLMHLNPAALKLIKANPNLRLPDKTGHKKVKPQGPDPSTALDLVDMVDDEAVISDLEEVAGWNPHLLFQDSAVPTLFYYIPRELRLVYDSSGYNLRVQYNSIQGAEQGSVLITMEIKAPYHSGDVKVLEKILKSNWDPASEVRALPAFGAQADLETITAGFGLDAGQLHLTSPSTLRQACSLVINVTPDQAEALIAQMSSTGVSGNLNVPVGERPVSIPVILAFDRFSGEVLEGLKEWQNGKKVDRLINLALFPVRIKSVNAFVSQGNSLKLRSKSLKKSVVIKPRGAKPFRLPSVSKLFGHSVVMAWLDTEIISDCKSCRKHIDKMVRSGIGTSPMETVTFEAIPDVFDQYNLYKLIVEVKSRFFSANGDYEEVREMEITPDSSKSASVNLYIPPGMQKSRFQYRLRVISADGREILQDSWQPGTSTHIYLGSYQLRPVLGEPPQNESDTDTGNEDNGNGQDADSGNADEGDGGYYDH